jgi:cytochrome c
MICRAAVFFAALGLPICQPEIPVEQRVTGGDPVRGRVAITETGCNACHVIPGIPGPHGNLGPPLEHFSRRALIAGVVPNQPTELIRFIRDAPSLEPATAMPRMPISEAAATDIAAYLMTLR